MTEKNPHAVALGRRGGRKGGLSTSKVKRLAAKTNGAKGGRPRKFCPTCRATLTAGDRTLGRCPQGHALTAEPWQTTD